MCFVGHGAFGLITKQAWVPYFGVVGIGHDMAFRLMPLVGALDVLMGCLILLRPRPAVALWMIVWAMWTALLRPLSGEPVWEALERAGNYGVPAALWLWMVPPRGWRGFFGEALGKVIRSKLSSCQLSTYFVGRLAFHRLRQRVQREQGVNFSLGRFHEAVLSHGTLPVKYLPELMSK